LWRDKQLDFGALRKRDPRRSLAERWAWLLEHRPDIAAEDFEYVPTLIDVTWIVMVVPEQRVIFTIGLSYHYGQYELLLSAPELEDGGDAVLALKKVLNELGKRVRGGLRIRPGDVVEVAGRSLSFQAYLDEHFAVYPAGLLAAFDEAFGDVVHEAGGTLPILWADLGQAPATKRPTKKRAVKKPAAKKRAVKKPAAKKRAVKKPAAKKRAVKKRAVKKPAAKKKRASTKKRPAGKKLAKKRAATTRRASKKKR
jgi:hypothetical protein